MYLQRASICYHNVSKKLGYMYKADITLQLNCRGSEPGLHFHFLTDQMFPVGDGVWTGGGRGWHMDVRAMLV